MNEPSAAKQPFARPLRIAVVGAGLVGSTTSLALSRLGNVQVTAFEKAPIPREAGAWISLTVSGIKVLTKLIPPKEINAIAYRPPDNAVYVTRHWRTGEDLVRRYSSTELRPDCIQGRTHREPLLKTILRHLPPSVVRYGHRVSHVAVTKEGDTDVFSSDGNSLGAFDLVVAADGLYSNIRKKYWPGHRVSYRGTVAYRSIFPKSKLKKITTLHDDSSAWRKDGEVVFLSEVGLGMYGVVIIRPEDPEYAATLGWQRSIGEAGLERLQSIYKNWDPVIPEVLSMMEDIQAYPLESGKWLSEMYKDGRVAFVGDSAHPTAGAYGVGAAMGFCDGWALYRSLEGTARRGKDDATLEYDVPLALEVFQEARSPFLLRVEKQMELDMEDAKYVAAAGTEDGWIRKFKDTKPADQWLTEHDVELEVQKTIMGIDRRKKGDRSRL